MSDPTTIHPLMAALRPYLSAWGWDHPDEVLTALASAATHSPDIYGPALIKAPTHVTVAQAARILKRPGPSVAYQSKPGGRMQAEEWWGTRFIPVHLVAAELRRKAERAGDL